jgi:predicted component of type VI protein secretion system
MPEFNLDNLELKKNGFIYEATEATSESMADLPKNRTLLMAELTGKPPAKPELTYELETMDDVFNHFKPECKVEFNNEEGASVNEKLEFNNVGDFGKKALTNQSEFLGSTDQKRADHQSFSKQLQNNKVLQKVLSDSSKKAAYIALLKTLLQDLEENG